MRAVDGLWSAVGRIIDRFTPPNARDAVALTAVRWPIKSGDAFSFGFGLVAMMFLRRIAIPTILTALLIRAACDPFTQRV